MKKFKSIVLAAILVICFSTLIGCAKDEEYYNVKILPTENGVVTTNLTKAYEGDIVNITVTPNANYFFDKVLLDGEKLEELSFTMPAHDVEISVVFVRGYNSTIKNEHQNKFSLSKTFARSGEVITLFVEDDYVNIYEPKSDVVDFQIVSAGIYVFNMPEEDVEIDAELLPYSVSTSEYFTLTKSTAVYGETITVTMKDEYLNIYSLTSADVELTEVENGVYTFTMPAKNVVISAEKIPYTISEHEGYTLNKTTAVYGDRIELTFKPEYDRVFKPISSVTFNEVYGDTHFFYFIMPANNVEITLEKISYTIVPIHEEKLSIDKTQATYNEIVTITIKEEYVGIYEPVRYDIPGADIVFTKISEGVYTFNMPTDLVGIDVQLIEYTISTSEYFTLNKSTAVYGETITVTLKEEYLNIYSLTSADVELAEVENGVYTFTMPAKSVEINAINITYSISVNEYCSSNKETAIVGETVTVTVKDEYLDIYKLASEDVELTKVAEGTYTFIMPAKDVTIFVSSLYHTISTSEYFTLSQETAQHRDFIGITMEEEYVGLYEPVSEDVEISKYSYYSHGSFYFRMPDKDVTITVRKIVVTFNIENETNGTVKLLKNGQEVTSAEIGDELTVQIRANEGYSYIPNSIVLEKITKQEVAPHSYTYTSNYTPLSNGSTFVVTSDLFIENGVYKMSAGDYAPTEEQILTSGEYNVSTTIDLATGEEKNHSQTMFLNIDLLNESFEIGLSQGGMYVTLTTTYTKTDNIISATFSAGGREFNITCYVIDTSTLYAAIVEDGYAYVFTKPESIALPSVAYQTNATQSITWEFLENGTVSATKNETNLYTGTYRYVANILIMNLTDAESNSITKVVKISKNGNMFVGEGSEYQNMNGEEYSLYFAESLEDYISLPSEGYINFENYSAVCKITNIGTYSCEGVLTLEFDNEMPTETYTYEYEGNRLTLRENGNLKYVLDVTISDNGTDYILTGYYEPYGVNEYVLFVILTTNE